jgi:GT2 family glycosyltransferase
MPDSQNEISPMISVIILNWNGYKDTIECLESLSESYYQNFEIFLADNASTDISIDQIKEWIKIHNNSNSRKIFLQDNQYTPEASHNSIKLHLIENSENYGFAKGNNIAANTALQSKTDYILFLNNDTIVEKDFLSNMMSFFGKYSEFSAATPQIRYFDSPQIIWNCGGKLKWPGSRKYFFDGKPSSDLPHKEFLEISFVTGCALMVKSDVLRKFGLLSEDFFFGEEDFEYSLRLRKNRIKTACVLNSVIYHKVNSSISKTSELVIGKIFIHYLNRFINLRNYFSAFGWQIWRYSYLTYILLLLKFRHKISFKVLMKFSRILLKNSKQLKGVSKETFDKFINFDFKQNI